MNKLRLAHLLPTLPRYNNRFNKGNYANGNYAGFKLSVNATGVYKDIYTDDNIPKEYLERPWYVKSIVPSYTSAHKNSAHCCLYVIIDKEEL